MSARETALTYAVKGWPVFPVSNRKIPMFRDWADAASTDRAQIRAWWTEWPYALIGTPTGVPIGELADYSPGIAALDIDMKNGKNGLRTLAGLGYIDLPKTPTVLTPSGGFHLHFELPEGGFRNTVGGRGRGIGDGLDWRACGGLVILPSPGSGYRWGEWNYDNCVRVGVPADLLPREVEPNPFSNLLASIGPTVGGLTGVERCLRAAEEGERNCVLYWAACRFAEAVTARLISEDDARIILSRAASITGLTDREIARTISSAFNGKA